VENKLLYFVSLNASIREGLLFVIVWLLDLQLPMQSVPITT